MNSNENNTVIWKVHPHNNDYLISNTGKIYSRKRKKFLAYHLNNTGYQYVGLPINGHHKRFSVHYLVAITFIPNPLNLSEIDHIDRNKLNNNCDNLRWITKQANNLNKNVKDINNSGTTGVYWSGRRNKWYAQIKINYKQIYLGSFKSKDRAIEVRKEAEEKFWNNYTTKHQ